MPAFYGILKYNLRPHYYLTVMSRLDVNEMKEYKPVLGLPFMQFLAPEKRGKEETFYAYLVKAVGEPANVTGKDMEGAPKEEKHQVFEILELKPEGAAIPRMPKKTEEFIEVGKKYRANLTQHASLWNGFEKLLPLDGKEFAVMNKGKGKTKQGKPFWMYVVMPASGEMTLGQLIDLNAFWK